jgi:UPF0271 protein
MKRLVLDATAFFGDFPLEGELLTVPGVVAELVDVRARCRLEVLEARGLQVREPGDDSLDAVREAARSTGDVEVLSPADRELLALAVETGASVATDDFAVQNVARFLGITVVPLQQRRARPRRWRYRCTGCGRVGMVPGDCPVCGARLERTIK